MTREEMIDEAVRTVRERSNFNRNVFTAVAFTPFSGPFPPSPFDDVRKEYARIVRREAEKKKWSAIPASIRTVSWCAANARALAPVTHHDLMLYCSAVVICGLALIAMAVGFFSE